MLIASRCSRWLLGVSLPPENPNVISPHCRERLSPVNRSVRSRAIRRRRGRSGSTIAVPLRIRELEATKPAASADGVYIYNMHIKILAEARPVCKSKHNAYANWRFVDCIRGIIWPFNTSRGYFKIHPEYPA